LNGEAVVYAADLAQQCLAEPLGLRAIRSFLVEGAIRTNPRAKRDMDIKVRNTL
jgi:hypothetical protein